MFDKNISYDMILLFKKYFLNLFYNLKKNHFNIYCFPPKKYNMKKVISIIVSKNPTKYFYHIQN